MSCGDDHLDPEIRLLRSRYRLSPTSDAVELFGELAPEVRCYQLERRTAEKAFIQYPFAIHSP